MRTILATLLAALAVNAHADTIPAECEKALQGTFERDKRIGGSFADELTREFKLPMKVQKQPDGWKIAGRLEDSRTARLEGSTLLSGCRRRRKRRKIRLLADEKPTLVCPNRPTCHIGRIDFASGGQRRLAARTAPHVGLCTDTGRKNRPGHSGQSPLCLRPAFQIGGRNRRLAGYRREENPLSGLKNRVN